MPVNEMSQKKKDMKYRALEWKSWQAGWLWLTVLIIDESMWDVGVWGSRNNSANTLCMNNFTDEPDSVLLDDKWSSERILLVCAGYNYLSLHLCFHHTLWDSVTAAPPFALLGYCSLWIGGTLPPPCAVSPFRFLVKNLMLISKL